MVILSDVRLLAGLAFLGVVIAICVWVLLKLFPQVDALPPDKVREARLDALQRRYARGEISKAEYEALRREIKEQMHYHLR